LFFGRKIPPKGGIGEFVGKNKQKKYISKKNNIFAA